MFADVITAVPYNSLVELAEAVRGGNVDAIKAAMAKVAENGMSSDEQYKSAEKALGRLEREGTIIASLETAIKEEDRDTLAKAMEEADELELERRHGELVSQGRALLEKLNVVHKAKTQIERAMKAASIEDLDDALNKARENGVAGDLIDRGEKAKELIAKMVDALATKDKEELGALLAEAKEIEMDNEKTRQARLIVDRESLIKETKAKLEEACTSGNVEMLDEALERVNELGMEGPEVDAAKKMRDQMEGDKEASSALTAAMKNVRMKAEGKHGIEAGDLGPLEAAIAEAKGKGVSDDAQAMKAALEFKKKLEDVLVTQAELQTALDQATDVSAYHNLKQILSKAERLDMTKQTLYRQAKRQLKKLDQERRGMDNLDEEYEGPDLTGEGGDAFRKQKMEEAMDPKFHFSRYPGLRSQDEFAKGVLLNKKKVKQAMLRWQSNVIHKSLLEFNVREYSRAAKYIHKAILGYAGDKSLAFPATLAQDVLSKGLELSKSQPDFVDEIYLQIMKHLTLNPRSESIQRGWQIMCMAVGTFPPTHDFENYLLNFLLQNKDKSGAEGNYARYCLRRLEGILNSGPSGFVPSVEEIQAYKERPPILATIELVDGTPLTEDLPITPDLNVSKVLDICIHFMELQDARAQFFGIFVEDIDDEVSHAVVMWHMQGENPFGCANDREK